MAAKGNRKRLLGGLVAGIVLALALAVVAAFSPPPPAPDPAGAGPVGSAPEESAGEAPAVTGLSGYRIVPDQETRTLVPAGWDFPFQESQLWRLIGSGTTVEVRVFERGVDPPLTPPAGWDPLALGQGSAWIGRPGPWVVVWQGEGRVISFTQVEGSSRLRLTEIAAAVVADPPFEEPPRPG